MSALAAPTLREIDELNNSSISAPRPCGHCGEPATCHAADAGSGHPDACDACCAEWCEDGACEPMDAALLEEISSTAM